MDLLTADDVMAIESNLARTRVEAMIKLISAKALDDVPCLAQLDPAKADAVKAVLVPAVLRWATSPAGGDVSEAAGPFSRTIKVPSGLLWDSEIAKLRGICSPSSGGRVARARGRFPGVQPMPSDLQRPTGPVRTQPPVETASYDYASFVTPLEG